MKYEDPYVLEWVAYHHCIGINHFYIFDNDENSGLSKILHKYIDEEIVTLIHAPGPTMMFKCYNQVINSYKDESKYIAFIDADEFIVPIEDTNVFDVIDQLITKYKQNDPKVSGLVMKWAVYGSGNHINKPEGLMIENYLWKENGEADKHVKTVVDPRAVSSFNNPHFPLYKNNYYSVDERGSKCAGPFLFIDNRDIIRVNHYYYKSEKEFRNSLNNKMSTINPSLKEVRNLMA